MMRSVFVLFGKQDADGISKRHTQCMAQVGSGTLNVTNLRKKKIRIRMFLYVACPTANIL